MTPADVLKDEIAREQRYLDALYARVDALREQVAQQLPRALRQSATSAQQLLERDAAVTMYRDRRAALEAAENGLCFGRIDMVDGARYYIGRIGLRADPGDGEPLLIDWRAPAARPFYLATS
jgi:DNA helicase IV